MMNADPSRIPAEQENKPAENIFKLIFKRITHQWLWKLTSLILAICLWGGLVSQDATLPREKTFTNVKINIANTAVMKNNGFIVVDGLDNLQDIQIKVKVPQKYYSSISPSNYNVRVDLSQIKEPGEQTLKLISNSTSTVYGSVIEMSQYEIPVTVERYVTRTRIPVEIRAIGEAPQGHRVILSNYDPTRVDIAGPASVVNAVARCVVEYDYSTLPQAATSKAASCDFYFESADGKRLDSTQFTVTSQTSALQNINVFLDVLPQVTAPIATESLISGEPAQGYEITGVTILPDSVTLAGEDISRYLNGEKVHPYSNINVSGKKQDVVSTLTLRIPNSMEYISDTMITVIVSIDPILSGMLPPDDVP